MNTVDKTPEQLMEIIRNTPWTFERQLLPEPDYRQIAATEAGKIPHGSVQEYLTDCDKIYNWLIEKPKKVAYQMKDGMCRIVDQV